MEGWLEVMYAFMALEDEPVLSLRPAMASLASSRYDFLGAAADMVPTQNLRRAEVNTTRKGAAAFTRLKDLQIDSFYTCVDSARSIINLKLTFL